MKNNLENESNLNKIKLLKELTKDSYSDCYEDNLFTVFKSINDILYLIYSNKKKSIISYDLVNNTKIIEIKNAHNNYITNFRYFNDLINNRDLIISISNLDNNIKLWNINNFECLLDINNIYKQGSLSSCFLNYKNKIYIITGNYNLYSYPESIKIYDLYGKNIQTIKIPYYILILIMIINY